MLTVALSIRMVEMTPVPQSCSDLDLVAARLRDALGQLFVWNPIHVRQFRCICGIDCDHVSHQDVLTAFALAQPFVVWHERAIPPAIRPILERHEIHGHIPGK